MNGTASMHSYRWIDSILMAPVLVLVNQLSSVQAYSLN